MCICIYIYTSIYIYRSVLYIYTHIYTCEYISDTGLKPTNLPGTSGPLAFPSHLLRPVRRHCLPIFLFLTWRFESLYISVNVWPDSRVIQRIESSSFLITWELVYCPLSAIWHDITSDCLTSRPRTGTYDVSNPTRLSMSSAFEWMSSVCWCQQIPTIIGRLIVGVLRPGNSYGHIRMGTDL